MKKNECNYCKQHPGRPCHPCSAVTHDSTNKETSYSTLYAAEFLLYAFHFVNREGSIISEQAPAHPLMMLVAEG